MNKYGQWANRIARWLNSYAEWLEQLDGITDAVKGIDYSTDRVQGGNGESGGSTMNLAVRKIDLEERCRRVELLLNSLSDGERIAARYYLDTGTTQAQIAHDLGIGEKAARRLIDNLPMTIALRNMDLLETV